MIIGVDFSLTSTGVCAITDGEAECITIKSVKEESWFEFPERIHSIGDGIAAWVDGSPEWVLETPAFLAKSSSLDRMFGGWWMLVDYMMRDIGWERPVLVTPTQLKKYATGKGNAKKEAVLEATIRRYPDVDFTGNDQADALVLAAIGAGVEGQPFESHTKLQLEVIDAVKARDIGGV